METESDPGFEEIVDPDALVELLGRNPKEKNLRKPTPPLPPKTKATSAPPLPTKKIPPGAKSVLPGPPSNTSSHKDSAPPPPPNSTTIPPKQLPTPQKRSTSPSPSRPIPPVPRKESVPPTTSSALDDDEPIVHRRPLPKPPVSTPKPTASEESSNSNRSSAESTEDTNVTESNAADDSNAVTVKPPLKTSKSATAPVKNSTQDASKENQPQPKATAVPPPRPAKSPSSSKGTSSPPPKEAPPPKKPPPLPAKDLRDDDDDTSKAPTPTTKVTPAPPTKAAAVAPKTTATPAAKAPVLPKKPPALPPKDLTEDNKPTSTFPSRTTPTASPPSLSTSTVPSKSAAAVKLPQKNNVKTIQVKATSPSPASNNKPSNNNKPNIDKSSYNSKSNVDEQLKSSIDQILFDLTGSKQAPAVIPEKKKSTGSFFGLGKKEEKPQLDRKYTPPSFAAAVVEEEEEEPQIDPIQSRIDDYRPGDELDLSAQSLDAYPPLLFEKIAFTLTNLNMEFNKLNSFTDKFSLLVNLEILNLGGNLITSVSAHVSVLTKLRELHLNGNMLKDISSELCKLTRLEKLSLQNNHIVHNSISSDIRNLRKLEELFLNGNPLGGTLPKEVGYCISLEVLDLDSCELQALPPEVGCLTRLIELHLGNNSLKELPETLGYCTRLAKLNVSDNSLNDLPISLGSCHGLGSIGSGIVLDRNPIKSQDMLDKYMIGTDHLLDFLEKRLALTDNYIMPVYPEVPPLVKPKIEAAAKDTSSGPKQPLVISPEKRIEMNKKINALTTWSFKTIDELKSMAIGCKQQLTNGRTMEEVRPIADKINALHLAVNKAKELLPKQRAVTATDARSNTGTDPLSVMKTVAETNVYDINVTLSNMKQVLALKTAAEDMDEVVQFVKMLRGYQDILKR